MDSFTNATLKLNERIVITNGSILTSHSKTENKKIYKLKAALQSNEDRKNIYPNIISFKETNLYLDRE